MGEPAWIDRRDGPARTRQNDIARGRSFEDVTEGCRRNPDEGPVIAAVDKTARRAGVFSPRIHPGIPVVTGPLWGIPWDEMVAWIESWESDTPLPEPKARWIDLV